MKKRFYVFSMLAAGMLLAGCSDDLEGGPDGGGAVNEGEVGYVKVALNLPSTSTSNFRATTDNGGVTFDDGIEAEYNVNDVILALFYGASEDAAKLKCAYNLAGIWNEDILNDENVTRKVSSVQEVIVPAANENVYALAIVNGKGGYFNVSSENKLQYRTTITEGNAGFADLGEIILAELYADTRVLVPDLATIAKTSDKGNFLMLNAPISNKAAVGTSMGDDHKVTTLAEITVWSSEPEAEANPDNIYVERAVAKVTVGVSGANNALNINKEGATYNGATVTFQGWKLQTTNKTMYAVRNVYSSDAGTTSLTSSPAWKTWGGTTTYVGNEYCRFFGTTPNPYRVYWGIDPNYFSAINSTSDGQPYPNYTANFQVYSKGDLSDDADWNKLSTSTNVVAEYCAENTTKAKAMQENNLTSVLLKANFKLKDSENTDVNDDLFMINNTSAIYTEKDFIQVATAALKTADANFSGTLSLKEGLTKGMTITTAADVSNLLQVTGGTELTDTQETTIFNACGSSIKYYKDGVMYYYTSLIEHFGDNPTTADGITSLDQYDDGKHLGRYGVLRNNWYELNITKVTGPGEPEIPEVPEEPADATQGYINATINVLSWAKRQQDVEL